MGSQSAKVFPPPTSYGAVQSPGTVSEVTPQGIAPANVLLPGQAGAGLGVNAPAAPVNNVKQNGGRGKFFSDMELDGFGGGHGPRKPSFPPPVKKPHLPPGGTLTAYKIDSGY